MKPLELEPEQFAAYPPLARKTVIDHLSLLKQLPPAFRPFLFKEAISFDWKFPVEQQDLLAQLGYLESLTAEARERELRPFATLRLSSELAAFDAINLPGQFLERLSAHLWATSQMDTFRSASEAYMRNFRAVHAEPAPAVSRLAIVVIGQGVTATDYRLFRKLRREGVYFSQIDGRNGLQEITRVLQARAARQAEPYAHWYIDGGAAALADKRITLIAYQNLASLRTALTAKMRQSFEARTSPETLRTMLAETTPESLGIKSNAQEAVLDRFKMSLFTEGSGTQIYSTTFVQWSAREALRRAQPLTLVARFAPRVREASMSELLSGGAGGIDPAGSLVDADMAAWYTWISLQRLAGADQARLLAWFEDHSQAVVVGPSFARGKEEAAPTRLSELLDRLAG
jgi:hypothetical protein